jgi:hypothetical protein
MGNIRKAAHILTNVLQNIQNKIAERVVYLDVEAECVNYVNFLKIYVTLFLAHQNNLVLKNFRF